ncbi:hypothetical protein VR7878_03986 [Vibrio ruber DSM 16370]|uniref:Type VI secretion system effector TseH-like domain-containing protein n=1 Tax=Vibrio ruber (strain DSM 16370 / JCM 11486 / BCRC 17186 / CECT 7878 / LMG 23124 / VR1) TaxID=1123498 RepID=A0A1R4LU09_VIBR1|nr:hypothetical protein [Vibrio ruber]SJN60082.1 hypothetical protein VR7878_03986 [Vibrio ruber DSM 16370]
MGHNIQTTPKENTKPATLNIQLDIGDFLIPIVYPDYLVHIPKANQEILGIKILDDREAFGHAGVLIINGKTGVSKYYEYGRYDALDRGIVRKPNISNAVVKNGRVTESSLTKILKELSDNSGQHGRIEAVVFIGDYYSQAEQWLTDPNGPYRAPDRESYNVRNFNCIQFVLDLLESLSIDTHWPGLISMPDEEMEELQEDYRDLRYNPETNKIYVEEIR